MSTTNRSLAPNNVGDRLAHVLEVVVCELVDNTDTVKVTYEAHPESRDIIVTIAPDLTEVGKVLGKRGVHLKSMRTLVEAIATKYKCRVTIHVNDGGQS